MRHKSTLFAAAAIAMIGAGMAQSASLKSPPEFYGGDIYKGRRGYGKRSTLSPAQRVIANQQRRNRV